MNEIQTTRHIYPFCALVGQTEMKLALILNLINPAIGGVLIRGEKGTAKSTAVRALAAIPAPRAEVEGCLFQCDPSDSTFWCDDCRRRSDHPARQGALRVVDLPVGATEDRVVGTLDIEQALRSGVKKFEPGILAAANRNILYVDEVNLLDDHLVDVLLDAAAMGVNAIEREGVSFAHPSRFLLVGTMNPEEGDLRPQLLDRFGLVVDVRGEQALEQRVEVIRRRLAFERDPEQFILAYEPERLALQGQISDAQAMLPEVRCSDRHLEIVADLAIRLAVDGHRADITLVKAALSHAALAGRPEVCREDLTLAARLALPHRLRRQPFEEGSLDLSRIDQIIAEHAPV